MSATKRSGAAGFTLLEVIVGLAVLALGAAMTLSLISGSLGKIRKIQQRTRAMEHAESVMELSLLDPSIKGAATLQGDFEDGSRWTVLVSEFEMPRTRPLPIGHVDQTPVKLLQFMVEITGPRSQTPDFRLHTLKLVSKQQQQLQSQPPGLQPPQPMGRR